MAIAGLILDHEHVRPVTSAYLRTKQKYFPGTRTTSGFLDYILDETKATDIRSELRSARRDERRHAVGFLDKLISLLETHNAHIVGRVWVKEPGTGLNPVSTYTYAIQDIATHFDHHLQEIADIGQIVCDSRRQVQNREVSHSIFTWKHRLSGDALPRLVESPTFGVSDNHAGLQIADLLVGALIFPMACRAYCAGCSAPAHMSPHYDTVRDRFGGRIRALQHLYVDPVTGRSKGGIVVSDRRGKRGSPALFRSSTTP